MLDRLYLLTQTRQFLAGHLDAFAQEWQHQGDHASESDIKEFYQRVMRDYLRFHAQVDRRLSALKTIGVVAISGNELLDTFLDGIDKIGNLSVSPSPQSRELEMARLWLEAIDRQLSELDRKLSAIEIEFFCD